MLAMPIQRVRHEEQPTVPDMANPTEPASELVDLETLSKLVPQLNSLENRLLGLSRPEDSAELHHRQNLFNAVQRAKSDLNFIQEELSAESEKTAR